jgi:hypothetical protein
MVLEIKTLIGGKIMSIEHFDRSSDEKGEQHFRSEVNIGSAGVESGLSHFMQEKQEHPSLPSLTLQNDNGTVFSLAALANHGVAYQQCVAAVKHALSDPTQNTKHVHRSEQWISNRCAVAESNHNKYIDQRPHRSSGTSASRDHSAEEYAKHQAEESKYRQEKEAESRRNQQRYESQRQDQLERQRSCQNYHANPHLNIPKPQGCF